MHLSRNSKQNLKLWTTSQDYAVTALYVKSHKGFWALFKASCLGKIDCGEGLFAPSKHRTIADQNLVKNCCFIGHFFVV